MRSQYSPNETKFGTRFASMERLDLRQSYHFGKSKLAHLLTSWFPSKFLVNGSGDENYVTRLWTSQVVPTYWLQIIVSENHAMGSGDTHTRTAVLGHRILPLQDQVLGLGMRSRVNQVAGTLRCKWGAGRIAFSGNLTRPDPYVDTTLHLSPESNREKDRLCPTHTLAFPAIHTPNDRSLIPSSVMKPCRYLAVF